MDRAYGSRASTYDDSFHPALAADYIKWANFQPGQSILDMACGTGLVTLAAKQAVGPTGNVVGIDITPGMLAVARQKAKAANEDITFLQADVTDLSKVTLIPSQFDVITCASAFVLLSSRTDTLRHWATYLKPNGRMILDAPSESTYLEGQVFALAARELGIDILWDRSWVHGPDSLTRLFESAGLAPVHVFTSPVYQSVEYDEKGGLERLRRLLEGPFSTLEKVEEMKTKAEEIYRREFARRERGGKVRDEVSLYIGIAELGKRP